MTVRRAGVLATAALVAGCWWTQPNQPELPPGAVGDDGRRTATLAVNVRAGGKPVAGAVVSFSGAGLAPVPEQTTGADGAVAFVAIAADDRFVVRAEAPGFVPAARTTDGVTLLPGYSVPITVNLTPATGYLQGRVITGGLPLAGAVVSDGRHSCETDALGRFHLAVDRQEPVIKVAATGYEPRVIGPVPLPAGEAIGDVILQPSGRKLSILVDGSCRPFGSDKGDDRLSALYELLSRSGAEVKRLDRGPMPQLAGVDALLVPVPSKAYAADEIARIVDFVLEGGKLVVLGEWGGYGGFDVSAANALLHPFNLAFGADTLRAPDHAAGLADVLRVANADLGGVLTGVRQAVFYQAASVQVIGGDTVPLEPRNTRLLTRLGKQGMRIASVWGEFAPLGVSLAGAGRVVAVGDATVFTGEDSDGDGTMNLLSGDNRTLAWNIFRW